MPEKKNKFEMNFFIKRLGGGKQFNKTSETNKTPVKSPTNRVKIAAPYAYVEVRFVGLQEIRPSFCFSLFY